MKKIIQTLLTPVIFRVVDFKFIKIEIQFIAWSIAIACIGFSSGMDRTDFGSILLSAIPFMIMVGITLYAQIKPSIKTLFDIPEEWWISRLNLSMKTWHQLSPAESELQRELLSRFSDTYGIGYKEIKAHWIHKAQILILIIPSLITFFLGMALA